MAAGAGGDGRYRRNCPGPTFKPLPFPPGEHRRPAPVVMLDAHSDEVGFMIRSVLPNGTMRFLPLGRLGGFGRFGPQSAGPRPGRQLGVRVVRGPAGPLACRRPKRGKAPEIADMVIDVGARSAEEVAGMGIGAGAPVVPDVLFEYNEKNGVMLGQGFRLPVGAPPSATSCGNSRGRSCRST